MVILTLIACSIAAMFTVFYWLPRRRLWTATKEIPGPKPYPIVGNALMFWGCSGKQTFRKFTQLCNEYGTTLGVWFGSHFVVGLRNPDDIQTVLRSAKIRNRSQLLARVLIPLIGDGLITNRDEEWKHNRKIFQATFHYKILDSYMEIFGRKTRKLLEKLDEIADGRPVDIYDYLGSYALDVVCETAIGTTMDSLGKGATMLKTYVYDNKRLIRDRILKPWLLNEWIFQMTKDGKEVKANRKGIMEFSKQVYAQKLEEYHNGDRRPGVNTSTGKTVNSFLDMLIEDSETNGSMLTPEQVQVEIVTMAVTGYETTASTMAFLLLLLAIHPEVQQQVAEEMDTIFDGDDEQRVPTAEDLLRMPVLECTIKECLRLYPAIPFLPREIDEDVLLPSGYTLPKDCSAVVFVYALHRNKEFFPEPDKFKPDRWLPENSADIRPNTYLPFGAGLRNCVGQKYAVLLMKAALSPVIRRYKITTDCTMEYIQDNIELSTTTAMSPGDYLLSLEKRC